MLNINKRLITKLVSKNRIQDLQIETANAVFTLNTAIQQKNKEIINIVLNKIDAYLLNKYDDEFKRTPLQMAILNRDMNLIRTLLDKGAESKTKDFYGKDAFDYAIQTQDAKIMAIVSDQSNFWCIIS